MIIKICDKLSEKGDYINNFTYFKKGDKWYFRAFDSMYPDIILFENEITQHETDYKDIMDIIDMGKIMKKINT